MEAIYRINTNDLGIGFVNSVMAAYPGQDVEIRVREQEDYESDDCGFDEPEQDATEYLMRSPANREHLERAIKNIEEGKNLVSFETMEQLEECVRERHTEKGAAMLQEARERGASWRPPASWR